MSGKWVVVALVALVGCTSRDRCAIPVPAHLGAATTPTDLELRTVLLDAERRPLLPLRLSRNIRLLRAALDTGHLDTQCRALRSAHDALDAVPNDASSAAQRNAVALALDLTAAALLRPK